MASGVPSAIIPFLILSSITIRRAILKIDSNSWADHHGGAHAPVDLLYEQLELHGGDGVEAGEGLVEKEHLRIEGHGPGYACPFLMPPDSSDGRWSS